MDPASSEGTAASNPPLVWGSWASVTMAGSMPSATRKGIRHEAPVVRRAAGLHAGRGQLQRARQGRQRRRLEDETRAGRPSHLEAVAQQPEAGHVRRGPDAVGDEHLGRRPIEGSHLLDGRGKVRLARPTLARPRDQDTGPQSLGQDQGRRPDSLHPCAAACRGGPPRSPRARTWVPGPGSCGRRRACRPPHAPSMTRPRRSRPARPAAVPRGRPRSTGRTARDRPSRTRRSTRWPPRSRRTSAGRPRAAGRSRACR